jgi:hypothetical protein
VYERDTPEFAKFFDGSQKDEMGFPTPELMPGTRAIIWIDIEMVGTSCGFGVPLMKFEGHSAYLYLHDYLQLTPYAGDTLNKDNARKEAKDKSVEDPYAIDYNRGMKSWWVTLNSWSLDGLPGLMRDRERATAEIIKGARDDCGLKVKPIKPHGRSAARDAAILVLGAILGTSITVSILQWRHLLPSFSIYA